MNAKLEIELKQKHRRAHHRLRTGSPYVCSMCCPANSASWSGQHWKIQLSWTKLQGQDPLRHRTVFQQPSSLPPINRHVKSQLGHGPVFRFATSLRIAFLRKKEQSGCIWPKKLICRVNQVLENFVM